jgi:hypothetical protein
VGQVVTETADFLPFDMASQLACFGRQMFSRFADDFQVAKDRIAGLLIGRETIPVHAGGVTQDLLAGL